MLVPSIGKPYAAIKGGITSERGVPAPKPADRRSYLCSAPAARLRIGPAGAFVPSAGHHCPWPVRPVALRTSQARSFAAVVGQIGRGAGRGRGEVSVGGGLFKKKKKRNKTRIICRT